VSLGLKCLVQFDYGLVSEAKQDADFMHDLRSLLIICQVLLVDGLDGNKLSCHLVHSKVDLAEGSPSKHLSSPVEFGCRLRGFTCFIECCSDTVGNVDHLDDSGRDGTVFLPLHRPILVVLVLSDVRSDFLSGNLP